jgi:hypothetical protein
MCAMCPKRNRRRLTRITLASSLVVLAAVAVPLSALRAVEQEQRMDSEDESPGALQVAASGIALDIRRGSLQIDFSKLAERIEARREALRTAAEEATKKGDRDTAARNYVELISLPGPTLRDCREAIRCLEAGKDWASLAKGYEISAEVMDTIISAPPESFTRASPPAPPDSPEIGPIVEVQMELDGVWHANCRGTAENWLPRITRKQEEVRQERFNLLCRLVGLYRDRLNEPKKVIVALRRSLADEPFFNIPLEKLIADKWPLRHGDYTPPSSDRDMQMRQQQQVAICSAAMRDLVTELEKRNDFDAAIDVQSRLVLGSYSIAGKPYRAIETLWRLLQERPRQLPLPPVACLTNLSPERQSVEFDLDKFVGPKTWHKLNQVLIAARPGVEFDSLELTADMESTGGYVEVLCGPLRDGRSNPLGGVAWHRDQRKGRELRTSKVPIPAGTGVVYFNEAWLHGSDHDGVKVHRLTVKAAFRPAAAATSKPT